VLLGKALGKVRLSRVSFTIFRAKVWKILILEWILLLASMKEGSLFVLFVTLRSPKTSVPFVALVV
jgi:hypothetical protein